MYFQTECGLVKVLVAFFLALVNKLIYKFNQKRVRCLSFKFLVVINARNTRNRDVGD